MLWIQDAGNAAYIATGDRALPVKAGQHVRFTGISQSSTGELDFENITATVLRAAQTPVVVMDDLFKAGEAQANRVMVVEALVDRQEVNNACHLRLFFSVRGRPIFAWVYLDPQQPLPRLTDAIVRFKGVFCPTRSADGRLTDMEFKIAQSADIEVLCWLRDDPRFLMPQSKIESLLEQPGTGLVRVAGTVHSQEAGRYLRLRDETGQIEIVSAQARPCSPNERIEAIGYPVRNGVELQLLEGIYRPLNSTNAPATAHGESTGPLRLARQVHELSADMASRGLEVKLSGVVTWSHTNADFLFLQDASGGICLRRDLDKSRPRAPGRHIEVSGRTAMGDFAPIVITTQMVKLGDLIMPRSQPVSLDYALTGAQEAQWVEMRGYLRKAEWDGQWFRLDLVTPAGDYVALLPPEQTLTLTPGSVVRLHGVCSAITNERRQITGIRLWVPTANSVQIEEAAPNDPFELPLRSIASLGQYGPMQSFYSRVKVTGIVLHHNPGHALQLQQGPDSLLVLSRGTEPLAPGSVVEAVGILGRQNGRLVLREAACRKTGTAPEPAAVALTPQHLLSGDLDNRLVRIEGTLIERTVVGSEIRLVVQAADSLLEATLTAGDPDATVRDWPLKSQVALTGVCEVKRDDYGQAVASHLLLRSTRDVVVLSRPSWLTRERVLGVAVVLTIAILSVLTWNASLRARVRRQTRQIRQQLARESRLEEELQRASKLESLGLLAGGIAHDFNNLLTIVMGNLSLAQLDDQIGEETCEHLSEAEKATLRARDLTQQLLTFARGGSPVRSAVLLPEIVREVAQFALRGSRIACEFDFAPDLWPGNVDRGQISQVVQNIVINSMQAMTGGGVIKISMRNEVAGSETRQLIAPGRYLRMTIADNGPGIAPENLPRIFDPYFTTKKKGHGIGLATVYSIVRKHQGHVSVESNPGQGTAFHVLLPAAEASTLAPVPIVEKVTVPTLSGRVLLMDDEESIRRLASSMCRKLGLEITTVADGADAAAEYQRALTSGTPYNLVILDLTVPGGMGGQQALQLLQKIDPSVKAVVSSGYANEQVLANHQAHGFCAMVAKPYEVGELARVLSNVLSGKA
jgi:signal transduction histidine kinase/CheY-like chemotaxis protein